MEKNGTGRRRKIVILTVTERCNLECVYCYEHAKTKEVMSAEIAKSTIEYEFANSDAFDEIEFDLFGGEPTLRKDFIIELVEWTVSKQFAKPFLFFLITNGTLVHGEFQEWLLKRRKFVCVGLSLDGTPETHNRNRSNSYGKIDVDFFVRNFPEQGVRMTVHSETVGNLSSDIVWLHNLGFSPVDAVFAFGINWDIPSVKDRLIEELQSLCDYYLQHSEVAVCSIFDLHLPNLLEQPRKIRKWCGTGTNMVAIGVDGKRYPCQTFQPHTTANPIEIGAIDFCEMNDFSDPECSGCFVEPVCPNCYGMNHATGGDIIRRNKQLCEIMKIRLLAVAQYKGRLIKERYADLNMTPAELYQTIKAIQVVQSDMSVH